MISGWIEVFNFLNFSQQIIEAKFGNDTKRDLVVMVQISPHYVRVRNKFDALSDLVPYVQFKKVKTTHGGVLVASFLQNEKISRQKNVWC